MSFKVEHKHTLAKDDALARIRALGDYLHNRHGIHVSWEGEVARFTGKYLVVSIDGSVRLDADRVVFEGKDPGFLWRGKAKDYLAIKMKQYLDPGVKVEQLPKG